MSCEEKGITVGVQAENFGGEGKRETNFHRGEVRKGGNKRGQMQLRRGLRKPVNA